MQRPQHLFVSTHTSPQNHRLFCISVSITLDSLIPSTFICLFDQYAGFIDWPTCASGKPFLILWPCLATSEILVLRAEIKPVPPVLEAWSFNYWTVRKVPLKVFLKVKPPFPFLPTVPTTFPPVPCLLSSLESMNY